MPLVGSYSKAMSILQIYTFKTVTILRLYE